MFEKVVLLFLINLVLIVHNIIRNSSTESELLN